MKNTQLQTLQKHLDEINKTMSDIKDEINSVDLAEDSNNISKLFSIILNVDKYRNLPQNIQPSLPKFVPGKIIGEELQKIFGTLSSSFLASDKHGYSIKTTQKALEAGSTPQVKQLLDKPEIITTIDTGYRVLYNVACVSVEDIWTSGNDNTMKLYSINQGSLLKTITTKSWNTPVDIAAAKSGDLVFIDDSDRTNRNLDICVSDNGARAVVVVNQAGRLRFRYTGHSPAPKNKPFDPRGITTDSQSHILSADYNNDCVNIIDQDGQFLRYIDCGLSKPWELCTDTYDNLFVAQFRKQKVKKIKYLQ
ncbi:uncharacterized protein LOC134280224 [Saccostrea cucullata]|uniref:uncharacterized protein LOC134280224 n=1 Tax=Saccostrea cuccullata TaxID=36930 RepID=UPI002ED3F878